MKLTSGKCPQGDYVLVDLRGTWNKPIGPTIQQKTVEMPDARVLSVILTIKDQGNYFLRLTGPEKTVSANADALRRPSGPTPSRKKITSSRKRTNAARAQVKLAVADLCEPLLMHLI